MKPRSVVPGLVLTLTVWAAPGVARAEDADKTPEQKQAEYQKNLEDSKKIDTGDTAWMLVSTGLVLFMVPGLALFYGGMVRRKNVLGTMMHSMVALGLIGI